jgi:hypothetical protein
MIVGQNVRRRCAMRVALVSFAAVFAIAAGALVARADDEKPVKESEVPKPAIDAVKKKYPTATLKGFEREEEGGKVSYEVKIEVKEKEKTRSIEVELSPEGKILAEEEKISEADVPANVKKALAESKYGKWKVKSVERVVKEEKESDPFYEFHLADGKKRAEVVFDKNGKITEEESKGGEEKGEKKEKGEGMGGEDKDD